jgi:hypothetical protein
MKRSKPLLLQLSLDYLKTQPGSCYLEQNPLSKKPETAGLSVTQILSIAARKAAKDSGKYISAASAFLLVLAVSLGVIPNLPRGEQSNVSAPAAETTEPAAPEAQSESEPEQSLEARSEVIVATAVTTQAQTQTLSAKPNLNTSVVSSDLSVGATETGFAYGFGADRDQLVRELLIFTDNILSAKVDIVRIGESYSYELRNAKATLSLEGEQLIIAASQSGSSQAMSEDGQTLTLVASGLKVLDQAGNEYAQQPLTESSMTVLVELDRYGQVIAASVYLN